MPPWRPEARGAGAGSGPPGGAARRRRRYAQPEVLPGSQYALITFWRGGASLDSARLGVISLSDGRVSDLGIVGTNPRYAAPGYIVYGRSGGAVSAVPFSLRRRAITGDPVR